MDIYAEIGARVSGAELGAKIYGAELGAIRSGAELLAGRCPWPGARRHSLWRRAKGLFLEFFPPGVYLRETFGKRAKK